VSREEREVLERKLNEGVRVSIVIAFRGDLHCFVPLSHALDKSDERNMETMHSW
jgi:hypothetical protein